VGKRQPVIIAHTPGFTETRPTMATSGFTQFGWAEHPSATGEPSVWGEGDVVAQSTRHEQS